VKDRAINGIGTIEPPQQWSDINWKTIVRRVKNLRQRIFRATQKQQWKQARNLMKLMLRSYSNLLLAVRRVTQENAGKGTPGIDRKLALTDKSRMALVRRMSKYKLWQASPVRRVYIPKAKGNRALGIPTISDRTAQMMVKNAWEPSWEARFESNSYGFRPGRSCHDAIEHAWLRLNARGHDRWVLDADIRSAFDTISHNHILKAVDQMPGRELIRKWLEAGYVEAEIFHATERGVPQGGVVSPLLSNIAFDGMQQLLQGKAGLIRYADDLLATAPTREKIEQVVPLIQDFLRERGLELHPEKTRIVSVTDGFNFLGFHVKHYQGKCLIKPQKEKVLKLLSNIREWLRNHRQARVLDVILHLNPILTGWANYYRHAVSKQVFAYVDHQLWSMLWRWCLRRHPNKGKGWIKRKYFPSDEHAAWHFCAKYRSSQGDEIMVSLKKLGAIKITRHFKVRGSASPDDPTLNEYWETRRRRKPDLKPLSAY
jgi:RNA-directed DNA polymerase